MGNAVEPAFIEYDFAKAGYVHDKTAMIYQMHNPEHIGYRLYVPVCTCSIKTSMSILEYLWKYDMIYIWKETVLLPEA